MIQLKKLIKVDAEQCTDTYHTHNAIFVAIQFSNL